MYKSNNGKFKEGIIWWDTKIDPKADVDIFFYIHDFDKRAENPYGFKSLIIDLKKSKEEIFYGYKTNLRNEIRKAQKDYDFRISYNKNPNEEYIESYVEGFNSFADFKGVQHTSTNLIKQMVRDGKLIFSSIYIGDVLLVSHLHYVSGDRTRLYQSHSTNNKFDHKSNGFANKLLTHNDILFFKELGVSIYDFGGIGNTKGDNSKFEGIIRFKKQFGGNEIILWKGTTLNGKRGEDVYNNYFK